MASKAVLVDNQRGFRSRRSCEGQLVGFIHDHSIPGGQINVAIMDFKVWSIIKDF